MRRFRWLTSLASSASATVTVFLLLRSAPAFAADVLVLDRAVPRKSGRTWRFSARFGTR
jgi:hypothetical protein